jgi:ubiquitin carboxyl-terminal hydrolase 14
MVSIIVKYNKNETKIENISTIFELKCEILELFSIPLDKQKISPPLKEPLRDGMKVMLIGTPEAEQLSAPPPETKFIEDMTETEIAQALKLGQVEPTPAGLENLGNTCYLNSVVQNLNNLNKLRKLLKNPNYNNQSPLGDQQIYSTLNRLFDSMNAGGRESVNPMGFVASIRDRFAQFNQRDNHGHYQQQDSEEFLRILINSLNNCNNSINKLFEFRMKSVLKNTECLDEEGTVIYEDLKSLTCHMGDSINPVSHLHEGVQLSLKELIEKDSKNLNKLCKYEKISGIDSLPEYLILQFCRFQWKGRNENTGTEATRTKIVRKINFGKNLDIFDFCSKEVQTQLAVGREARHKALDAGAELESVQRIDEGEGGGIPTGVYELVGVVSHQGRTADGGHYVGWAKRRRSDGQPPTKKQNGGKGSSDPGDDEWLKFDDEKVSETNWKSMVETGGLMGGLADSQMAYLCIYAKTVVIE